MAPDSILKNHPGQPYQLIQPSENETNSKAITTLTYCFLCSTVTLVFLEANGLAVDAPHDEVVITARALVNRRLRYDDLLAWICRNAT